MTSAWMFAVTSLAGVVLGSLLSYRVNRAFPPGLASHEPAGDLAVIERCLQAKLDADEARRRLEKVEHAYGQLMGWLYELEIDVDGVHVALYSDNRTNLNDLNRKLESWSWSTLRPPREVAATQYYWNDAIRDLMGEFYRKMYDFVGWAIRDLKKILENTEDLTPNSYRASSEFFDAKREINLIFSRIREEVRVEVGR
ncbi:hypothetical protein [Amycolatopsis sp. GA6-003]|uniref:hypothetical protein n=1 Tax=Amycolatopsis sp. GA6-003 TaxID=2652444 RepID=UPI003916DF92